MEDIEILKEINKNSKMGMDSLSIVEKKVQDNNFKNLLDDHHNKYQNIFDRTQELLVQNNEQIEDTPVTQKAMSWMGIQFNTMNDTSRSKISELLIQGNDMGIIKGFKLFNNHSFESKEIKNILFDFIQLQENNINDLKKFL